MYGWTREVRAGYEDHDVAEVVEVVRAVGCWDESEGVFGRGGGRGAAATLERYVLL